MLFLVLGKVAVGREEARADITLERLVIWRKKRCTEVQKYLLALWLYKTSFQNNTCRIYINYGYCYYFCFVFMQIPVRQL